MDFLSRGRALATNAFAMLRRRGEPVPNSLRARLDALGVDLGVLESRYPA